MPVLIASVRQIRAEGAPNLETGDKVNHFVIVRFLFTPSGYGGMQFVTLLGLDNNLTTT